jgi:hypothetical protein
LRRKFAHSIVLDSPLAIATKGIGLIQFSGGATPEPYFPGQERVPPLMANPVGGFEQFRTAWRQALEDPKLVRFFRSKLPESLNDLQGFDRDEPFAKETSLLSPFIYDAVLALGLSMCRASTSSEQGVSGKQIYEQFLVTEFEGASGRILFDNVTGTRDYLTHSFVLNNVRAYHEDGENDDGMQRFSMYPSQVYTKGQWVNVGDNEFIFADGTTTPPPALPPVNEDKNYIGNSGRATGYALMGIVMALSIASMIWTIVRRNERVVRSSQPLFLFLVSLGSFIMASTIVPLSAEESFTSNLDGLDKACTAIQWLYVMGAIVAFSPLFAKTRGIHQVRFWNVVCGSMEGRKQNANQLSSVVCHRHIQNPSWTLSTSLPVTFLELLPSSLQPTLLSC